jgi:hypothetical protein
MQVAEHRSVPPVKPIPMLLHIAPPSWLPSQISPMSRTPLPQFVHAEVS